MDYPYVDVLLSVPDRNHKIFATFSQFCIVDTGFTGDVLVPTIKKEIPESKGLKPKTEVLGQLAGGALATGKTCLAFITEIGDYKLPLPGIEISLNFYGECDHGLLGMNVIIDGSQSSTVQTEL